MAAWVSGSISSFANAVKVHIPKWLTIMVLSRDAIIVVSALAIAFVLNRRGFVPSRLGKVSTASQMLCVALAFGANLMTIPPDLLQIVFVATGVLTVGSGLHYLYRASSRRFVEPVSDADTKPAPVDLDV